MLVTFATSLSIPGCRDSRQEATEENGREPAGFQAMLGGLALLRGL